MERRVYSLTEALHELAERGVAVPSRNTIQRLASTKEIPVTMISGRYVIFADDLPDMARALRDAARARPGIAAWPGR